jgi:beta-N-acetylhexosaminidase
MPRLVDLKAMPYHLDDAQVQWVEDTIAGMTDEEKIGQLFFNLFHFGGDHFTGTSMSNQEILAKYHIGGARYHGGAKEQVQELLNELQSHSKIPLLIAANPEQGANGVCKEGTYIGSGAQCEAAGHPGVSRDAGYVSGVESTALGVNVAFAPIVDIVKNWRSTIVNTRAYGTDADTVIANTMAYVDGMRESNGIINCIKHWPGDGTEERDQHIVLGVNELSPEEWDESFGRVYKAHIANGVEMMMAGHIALPQYSKKLNPALSDEDIMPATLAEEITLGLLKTQLDFNGMVVTDASHMLGMTSATTREKQLPMAIAAGCDMFLFFNDIDEDFNYMLAGYRNGTISQERLHDALRRILGLKAKLGLAAKKDAGTLLRPAQDLDVIGCDAHLAMRAASADQCITLVKDTHKNLPLTPAKHKRIRLFWHTQSDNGGIYVADDAARDTFIAELESRGFIVTVNDGTARAKGPIEKFKSETDAAIFVANVFGYAAENNYRIRWKIPMSTDIPWYTWEVPTVAVSLNFTTHLHDITMVKTYINAYNDNAENIRQVVDKITGASEFKGVYNEHVWTEKWQAKL